MAKRGLALLVILSLLWLAADQTDAHPAQFYNNIAGTPITSETSQSKIAYLSFRRKSLLNVEGDFFLADVDGQQERRLTQNVVNSTISAARETHKVAATHTAAWRCFPAWSPDGRYLAFPLIIDFLSQPLNPNSIFASGYGLYVIDTENNDELRRLTDDSVPLGRYYRLAWSPDNLHLAFVVEDSAGEHIEIINVDGQNRHRLLRTQADNSWPAYSPDGQSIAFIMQQNGTDQLYTATLDGSNLRNLTEKLLIQQATQEPVSTPPASRLPNRAALVRAKSFVGWSSDSRRIAFVSTESGEAAIYVVDRGGSHVRMLGVGSAVRWSHNGDEIYFTAFQAGYQQIFRIDLSRMRRQQITQADSDSTDFDLSPDDTTIAFTSGNLLGAYISTVKTDGSERRILSKASGLSPRFQPVR